MTRSCVLVTCENSIHSIIGYYLSDDRKCFRQGFAAGLMLSISFLDLAHNAINSIGFLKGNLWVSSSVHLVPH